MGAKSYVVEGHMIDGFALVAFPALYRSSGIMTFIVNQNGIVYERNLGAATARIARGLPAYDPDEGWMAAP